MKQIKKLNFLLVLILASLFTNELARGQAQCMIHASKSGATVDVNGIAECMENRYGFDQNTMRRFNKKENAPEVEIHYDITDPQPGEKVTAIAVTKNFKNSVEDLYFTWYLARSDENGLPTGTMEEAKRLAMGIVARGEYDPVLFGQDYAPGNDIDHDGFWASYGGNDGVGAKPAPGSVLNAGLFDDDPDVACDYAKQSVNTTFITRCYRHNFGIKVFPGDINDGTRAEDLGSNDIRAGRDLIVECAHKFPTCDGFVLGDGEFGLEEEACWQTDPTNPDTDGDGIEDEADLVGLNQQQFTWKYLPGDYVGVVVEGTSMVPINEGCEEWIYANRMWCTHSLGAPPAWAEWSNGSRLLGVGCFETLEELYAACAEEYLVDEINIGGSSNGQTNGDGNNSSTNSSINMNANLDEFNQGMADYESCVDGAYAYNEREQVDPDEKQYVLNAYYKIMWAYPDFCSRNHPVYGAGNDGTAPISTHWAFMNSDECNDEGDVGFGYLAFVPLATEGEKILDPELAVLPEDPQFDAVNFGTDLDNTDVITVSATTSNPEVDEDFLYYEWDVAKCNAQFICDDALDEASGRIIFESFTQGMGVKHLVFRPTATTFTPAEDKIFLQARLVLSEHPSLIGGQSTDVRDLPIGAVETIIFPVAKKQVNMRFYRAEGNGTSWTRGREICEAGGNPLYLDVCPVYDYQVISVVAEIPDLGPNDRIAWQLNGEAIPRPFDDTVYPNAGSLLTPTGAPVTEIFIPTQGGNKDLQNISLTYKKVEGEVITDYVEGRTISLNNPIAVVEATGGATASERWDGTPSLNQFEANPGDTVTLQARIVPDYLEINGGLTIIEEIDPNALADGEVHLMWYFNGNFVDADFIANNPEFGIVVGGDTLTFVMDPEGNYGSGYEVTARVEKAFNEAHVGLLDTAWKIKDVHTITNDNSVTVRVAYDGVIPFNNNLRQYLASSIANAPHYLVFSLRLGVAMALVWFVLFGFSYAVRLNKNL